VLDQREPLLHVGLALLHVGEPLLKRLGLDGSLLQVGLGLAEARQAARGRAYGQRQHEKAAEDDSEHDPPDHERTIPRTRVGSFTMDSRHFHVVSGSSRAALDSGGRMPNHMRWR